jgi:hypothetical protein
MEKTEAKAMQVWNAHCRRFHHHNHDNDNDEDTELLPPPSPSPPPALPPPARRAHAAGHMIKVVPGYEFVAHGAMPTKAAFKNAPSTPSRTPSKTPSSTPSKMPRTPCKATGATAAAQLSQVGPVHPLERLHPAVAFSRMGAGAAQPPVECFWGVKGVHIIFDDRCASFALRISLLTVSWADWMQSVAFLTLGWNTRI